MRYADFGPKNPDDPERLTVDECRPGEIYECVLSDQKSRKKPSVQSLRLCVIKNGDVSLYNLVDGVQNAAVSFNVSAVPSNLYVHRPDIQLTVVK